MEEKELNQEALAAIRKRCPVCGKAMYQGVIEEIPAWICPDTELCGYWEPII